MFKRAHRAFSLFGFSDTVAAAGNKQTNKKRNIRLYMLSQHKLTATLYKLYIKSNPGDVNLCLHALRLSLRLLSCVFFLPLLLSSCCWHRRGVLKTLKISVVGLLFFPVRLSHHRWADVNYEDITLNFLIVHKGRRKKTILDFEKR